jgi:hypothetical protein
VSRNAFKPSFLIIGATKSGTTSLARYLGEHSDIFVVPEGVILELAYFAPPSRDGMLQMMSRRGEYAQKNWRCQRGFNYLGKVITGI